MEHNFLRIYEVVVLTNDINVSFVPNDTNEAPSVLSSKTLTLHRKKYSPGAGNNL